MSLLAKPFPAPPCTSDTLVGRVSWSPLQVENLWVIVMWCVGQNNILRYPVGLSWHYNFSVSLTMQNVRKPMMNSKAPKNLIWIYHSTSHWPYKSHVPNWWRRWWWRWYIYYDEVSVCLFVCNKKSSLFLENLFLNFFFWKLFAPGWFFIVPGRFL